MIIFLTGDSGLVGATVVRGKLFADCARGRAARVNTDDFRRPLLSLDLAPLEGRAKTNVPSITNQLAG